MKRSKRVPSNREQKKQAEPGRFVPVNADLLAPYNSYGVPKFVERGYYIDIPFRCVGCGKDEVWTGWQQKWWYEVAKGYVYSSARKCRKCRRAEQARRAESRRVHIEGIRKKKGVSK
jgi:hypothetical protein